jgi:hypothetical protein
MRQHRSPAPVKVDHPAMLVGESIWSRKLYTPPSIAYAALLAHLGRDLALVYSVKAQEPLPERWTQLLRQLP